MKIRLFFETLVIFVLSRLVFGLENNAIIKITAKLQPGKKLVDLLNQWDSVWYIGIIKNSYMLHSINTVGMVGQADWAFFPLFPLFAKLFSFLGFVPEVAGIIVNQIAFLLCIWVFYLTVIKLYDAAQARFITMIFALTPLNIFISASYSDTLFLLFSLVAFYNLEQKRYWAAAFAGAFLSSTRFFGIFFIVPFCYNKIVNKSASFTSLLQLIMISSGLILYMTYLHWHIGDALAFYHIQKAWGHMNVNWFLHPLNALVITFMSGQTYAKVCFIAMFIWIPYLLYKKYYEYVLFTSLCLLAPVFVGTLWSFPRYTLSLFPFYIAIGLATQNSQAWRYLVLTITVVFHFAFYLLWLNGYTAVI